VIATGPSDWFDKVDHFLAHPDERHRIIEAGRARVLEEHTYHHRAQRMLHIAGLS
jgi:spore maturation protein CgeB